jgi:hypothetical protein
MPFALALARCRIAHINDGVPVTSAAFADVPFISPS